MQVGRCKYGNLWIWVVGCVDPYYLGELSRSTAAELKDELGARRASTRATRATRARMGNRRSCYANGMLHPGHWDCEDCSSLVKSSSGGWLVVGCGWVKGKCRRVFGLWHLYFLTRASFHSGLSNWLSITAQGHTLLSVSLSLRRASCHPST
jgi:hypothetical protein